MPSCLPLWFALATAHANPAVAVAASAPRVLPAVLPVTPVVPASPLWAALPVIPSASGTPWQQTDPGELEPRSFGCATQTPGLPVTPSCRITLEAQFGPAAVGPVRRADR